MFRRKNIPVGLFVEALRNENCGKFEEAMINYNSALEMVNKNRIYNNSLKSKIVEKLKILRSVIEYNQTVTPFGNKGKRILTGANG